ncbi:hypothetical protein K2173_018543 [Erythroxylum novogranatense]|uniref:Uncharacterized protein n=1 Tax=Erythroxylum novogranatense TaxID=1862640 RepID=A0AAV8UAS9_9ROSI|nr:hypothetical protein K2173_018543 [Erythroxylum novogranatense]
MGQASSPSPVISAPSQLLPSMGQTASTGPASFSLPQATSSAGPLPTSAPLPQPQPSAHSPYEPHSSHVAISLPSHEALVSPDQTLPLSIPVGLVPVAMDVAHTDLPGSMDTSPIPHLIHEVPPPRPPDPCPIQQCAEAEPTPPDTTMEEPVPPKVILPSHDPNGPIIPVLTESR